MKNRNIKQLYDFAKTNTTTLLPTSTGLTFWDSVYGIKTAEYDRYFARRYSGFIYEDFMGADTDAESLTNLKDDIKTILLTNSKKYEEMYRVFLVADEDDPITYNYDMIETTGAQHSETKFGQAQRTKGAQTNTEGEVTDTHKVAPYNTTTATVDESADIKSQQTFTDGQRIDTDAEHTDEYDADEWTLTRKGNIGVQTAGDILRIHTQYWTEIYKFLDMIFNDICAELLLVEG